MNLVQALTIMELHGEVVTRRIIKESYRKLAARYHPDRNAAGLVMMQNVNRAYNFLARVPDAILFDDHINYPPKMSDAKEPADIVAIKSHGLYVSNNPADMKIWVAGKTFGHKVMLKSYGFRWCPERRAWWRYK